MSILETLAQRPESYRRGFLAGRRWASTLASFDDLAAMIEDRPAEGGTDYRSGFVDAVALANDLCDEPYPLELLPDDDTCLA